MDKFCEVCGSKFTKRRPNSCQKCYFKKRHQERYKNKPRICISCGGIFLLGHNTYCEDCKNNIKNCSDHHRIYFGRKFYKNHQDYWVSCRTGQPWAHRWVWENHFGEVPVGYDIHHKDGDKSNNEISNLEKLTKSEHQKKHWDQGDHDHEIESRIETLSKYRKRKC